MDIKRAKKEIKDSIEAYLAKDELGDYMIPQIRQRPILLMGTYKKFETKAERDRTFALLLKDDKVIAD